MADEATAVTQEAGVETPAATETPKPGGDVPPEVKAALRKANKEAETFRLKLQEYEDRDKSEAQKLTERAEAAEKRAAEIEGRALRLEIAAEKQMTPAQAKFLVGNTREEMEAAADEILAAFAPPASEPAGEELVPSLDLGTRSGSPMPLNGDPLERALRRKLGIT